jgi:enamine deaminase RidA (YjgF/YER057c/UK114 family)
MIMKSQETTMDPEQRLKERGHTLPAAPKPVASYVPSIRTGNLLFISGQVPTREGKPTVTGKVGGSVSLEQAQEAARLCVLNALAIAKDALGSLSKVRRVVRVVGHVAVAEGFTDVHIVTNGASDLLVEAFGEPGKHSRLALGAAALPLGVPFELDVVLEVA